MRTGAVFHGLCIDVNIERGGLHGGLAEDGAAACVGDGEPGSFCGELPDDVQSFRAGPEDIHRNTAGSLQGTFHDRIAIGVVFWNTIGFSQGGKGLGVSVDKIQEPYPQCLGALHQSADLLLHIRIFFLACCKFTDHIPEGDADGACQGAGTAAARYGCGGSQFFGKSSDGFFDHFHKIPTFRFGGRKSTAFRRREKPSAEIFIIVSYSSSRHSAPAPKTRARVLNENYFDA